MGCVEGGTADYADYADEDGERWRGQGLLAAVGRVVGAVFRVLQVSAALCHYRRSSEVFAFSCSASHPSHSSWSLFR